MSTTLKVLMAEDSESDAGLTLRHLAKAGFDFEHRRVETAADFQEALRAGSWDIVLCDYCMPEFEAPQALVLFQQSGLDIPFLVISGNVPDEIAVEMMRLGAHDYLMKTNLTRLPAAVRRELREAENRRERRRAEAALLENARKYQVVADNTFSWEFWLSVGGEFLYCSPSVLRITGHAADEFLAHPGLRYDILHPDDREKYLAHEQVALEHPEVLEIEFRIVRPDGAVRWLAHICQPVLDDLGRITGRRGSNRDITEQKQWETQFLRAQRLESLGTLASGIAHDLNNILTPILMAVPLLRQEGVNEQAASLLDSLEASAQRGADIVKQILLFTRGVRGEKAPLPTRDLLLDALKIVTETFPKSISVRCDLPQDLWTVVGDVTQLHQVVMNLCINARDAMPAGGTLTIVAENVTLDAFAARRLPQVSPGPFVLWKFADTGTGMPPEVMDHIFDPFYTTKAPGQGTGLGLSTVMGIIRSHEGAIQVSSVLGQGTEFRLYLPAAPEPGPLDAAVPGPGGARPG